ncbi:TNT domain-containing protein [Peribacillus frigoritolerans]|uniref:TNT domain-containing protein n=1 Tax=Peribacillus frigoritolerans TaxID=450367 RepID=UPI0039A3D71D
MFGNQLTEEQRQNGLLMALGIGGVAGAAKVADKVASGTKFVPYSKEFAQKQVQYAKATITDIARSGKTTLKNIGEEIGKKEIPKRISMEQVSLAGGPTLPQVVMEKQTIKEAYQKFTVKDSKVEGVSGESISKGTVKHVENLLKKSTCNAVELKTYLMKIDEYKGTNYADKFESFGKWPEDIQIPKDSSLLNADGSINWSEVPQGGYVLDKNGNAIKEEFIPKVGGIIDRYGPPNGRYTSPVMDGKPYEYVQRSLPYVEDATKYHQYKVIGDFSRLKEYVMNCTDKELKMKVEAQIERYYNGDYSKVLTQKGGIAEGFGSPGGGIQYELPLPVEWLEGLGMLKEIK